VYNQVIASHPGSSRREEIKLKMTPEGAFYDLQRNAWQVRAVG
jgi:hypothetical protein